jgi:hypothetical protein
LICLVQKRLTGLLVIYQRVSWIEIDYQILRNSLRQS